ncbi:MAG: LPS-assembly protein LptD, partial [Alphaproteobacteria bacterium]|nr:LPS-assembly protein LptD [Alphaproteobacteria bacterium]
MRKSFGFIGAITLILVLPHGAKAESAKAERATLDAAEISVDDTKGIISARGNVEARAQNRSLRAESLSYDRDKQQFIVPGKLSLTEKNGETISAANAIIDNALEQGRFNKLRLETASSGRMRAQAAERNGAILRLEDAIYTSCPECTDPDDAPLWQIRASRITYDRAAQNVSYSHPRLEVYGLPVFYLPILAHPDQTVQRQSGFLAPDIAYSNDRGMTVTAPYYHVLSPTSDVELQPTNFQFRGQGLKTIYRQRWDSS